MSTVDMPVGTYMPGDLWTVNLPGGSLQCLFTEDISTAHSILKASVCVS